MKKENIALGIFLAFIVGAGVYFYSSQTVPQNVAGTKPVVQREQQKVAETPSEIIPQAKVSTEGWKTCRNEEYGYEFKYPGEWYVYNMVDTSAPDSYNFKYADEKCEASIIFFGIDVLHSRGGIDSTAKERYDFSIELSNSKRTVDDWFNNSVKGVKTRMEPNTPQHPKINRIYLVDGERALLIDNQWYPKIAHYQNIIIFYNKNKTWSMHISNNNAGKFPFRTDTIETILSTFKFIQ